jgi:hypothetical protein
MNWFIYFKPRSRIAPIGWPSAFLAFLLCKHDNNLGEASGWPWNFWVYKKIETTSNIATHVFINENDKGARETAKENKKTSKNIRRRMIFYQMA